MNARIPFANDAAVTIADTLAYALQPDADPAQVERELIAAISPLCASRKFMGSLRDSIVQAAGIITGEPHGQAPELLLDPDGKSNKAIGSDQLRRRGALNCLGAIRQLEIDAQDQPYEPGPWLLKQRLDAEKLLKALPPMSPEAEGAVMAMAEYMHFGFTTGVANLAPGAWIPIVAMTPDELTAKIAELESEE